jgi:hypothetical protein
VWGLSRELVPVLLVLVAGFPHAAHREAVGASNTTIWVMTGDKFLKNGEIEG